MAGCFGFFERPHFIKPHPPPYGGTLPGCFDYSLLVGLTDALPRPVPGEARLLGRQMLHRALETIRLYQPRDVLEAQLVQQIVIVTMRAPLVEAAARRQDSPEQQMRLEAHALRLWRAAEELERRLRRYRRACALERREAEVPENWEYELEAVEAQWRGEARLVVDRVPGWVTAGKQF